MQFKQSNLSRSFSEELIMLKVFLKAVVPVALSLAIAGCGANPFGPGAQGGLDVFAKIGQAMSRPQAIDRQDNSQATSQAIVSEGAGAAKRLTKVAAIGMMRMYIVKRGIRWYGDTITYYETVLNKPSEEDPTKLVTGTGEVRFIYTGAHVDSLKDVNTALIAGLYSWHFQGSEWKPWSAERCSVSATVQFVTPRTLDSNLIKPGKTWLWAKVTSGTNIGDTSCFVLDSLDDVNHVQFGRGGFYKAADRSGDPKSFNYGIKVIHKNSMDPAHPYLRYQDNEGEVTFYLLWGKTITDSLYYQIRFKPNYEREGTIRKNGPGGKILVTFTKNEQTNTGKVVYH